MSISLVASRVEIVDKFGELDRKVKEFAPTAKEHKQLQDEIRSWYDDQPAEKADVVSGRLYEVQVSERGEERFLDVKAKTRIFALIGKNLAINLFNITLKAAETAIGADKLADLAGTARTGCRKLVVVLKAPATAAKAKGSKAA